MRWWFIRGPSKSICAEVTRRGLCTFAPLLFVLLVACEKAIAPPRRVDLFQMRAIESAPLPLPRGSVRILPFIPSVDSVTGGWLGFWDDDTWEANYGISSMRGPGGSAFGIDFNTGGAFLSHGDSVDLVSSSGHHLAGRRRGADTLVLRFVGIPIHLLAGKQITYVRVDSG